MVSLSGIGGWVGSGRVVDGCCFGCGMEFDTPLGLAESVHHCHLIGRQDIWPEQPRGRVSPTRQKTRRENYNLNPCSKFRFLGEIRF